MPSSPRTPECGDIDRRPMNGHDSGTENGPRSRRKSSSRNKERKRRKRQRHYRSKDKRKRKRRRRYSSNDSICSSSTDDSFSSSESDDSSSYYRRRDCKRKKHRHKKHKKRSSFKRKRREQKDNSPEERSATPAVDNDKSNETNLDSSQVPSKAQAEEAPPAVDPTANTEEADPPKRSKRGMMVPMSKAEYEKQQSQVRQVYDPESGRYRMVRGTGEIIESIVSRADHQRINQQATRGDGASFSRSALAAVCPKRSYQR